MKQNSKCLADMARLKRRKIQKPPIEEDTSNLPCDIVENILSKLPVKSLLRFKTVCKSWSAAISKPGFAKIQLQHSKKSDQQKLFMNTIDGFCLMGFENMSIKTEATLCFPIKKYRQGRVLCSCDGLVLLRSDKMYDKMFVLWNPSIRMFKRFSCPYTINIYYSVCGICYDPHTDDYKVVLVTNKFYVVYSYKDNSWTDKKEFCYSGISESPGVLVNGFLHWVVIDKIAQDNPWKPTGEYLMFGHHRGYTNTSKDNCKNPIYESDRGFVHKIIYFDPVDNNFKKLGKPHELEDEDIFYLTSLRNHLCLYRNTMTYDTKFVQIWMMKEYGDQDSWIETMTRQTARHHGDRPLCMTNEDNIVMGTGLMDFLIYNHKKKTFEETINIPRRYFYKDVVTCLDSMFFP